MCFPKCSWSAIRYKQGNYIYYHIGKDSYNWWRNCSWVVWEAKQKFCFFATIIPNWLSKTIQRICNLVFHILWELCVQILKKLATLVTIESTTKETTLKSTTKRLLALRTQQMVKMERAAAVRFFDLLLLHKGCQVYCNDYKFSQKRTDFRNLPEICNKSQKSFWFFLGFFCTFVFIFTSSCSQVSYKKAVLKNFAKLSEKYLYWSLFLKTSSLQLYLKRYSETVVCLWTLQNFYVDFLRTPPNNCFDVFLFLVVLNTATPTLMHFTIMQWFKTFKDSCLNVHTV